ncbi:hypothetical protein GCM10007377_15470 [Galliscardovia ingluviei]|uniref:Uncharacterized protein n=1 Tax=Galliscardovia ingluviei TaxID=1769422 RepID=A0A8J3EZJ7_9BIFI|nr:hypothetical protein [Galliscardovia ingluviei]GGI15352.1 hypothetical protein GCM10007377_15470 [Galliscardovia ingluviei]
MSIEQLHYAKVTCDLCKRAMREEECGGEDCYGLAHYLGTCKYEEYGWVVRPFFVRCPSCLDKQVKKLQTRVSTQVKRVFEDCPYRITTTVEHRRVICTIATEKQVRSVRVAVELPGWVEEIQLADQQAYEGVTIDDLFIDIGSMVSHLPEIMEELEEFGVSDAAAMARDIFRPLEGLRR